MVIVGNGFIYHLRDIALAERERFEQLTTFMGPNGVARCNALIQNLESVSGLFNQFDQLQKELQQVFTGIKYEELFERLDAVLTWYKERNSFQNLVDPKCFETLSSLVEKAIAEKIIPIVQSFEEQETSGAYGTLSNLFTGETVGDRVFNAQQASHDQIGIFTTNYDGFLVQLLRTNHGNGGYHFADGFGRPEGNNLVLHEPYISDTNLIAHLHSSYRFGYHDGEIIKTRPRHGVTNQMPILVYMNPNKKIDYIKRHYVLRRYWEEFEKWMSEADEVVIYGNSLSSDPHLVRVINKEGSRGENRPVIYAASRNPGAVLAKLTLATGAAPALRTIDTSMVGLDRLHELFTSPANLVVAN